MLSFLLALCLLSPADENAIPASVASSSSHEADALEILANPIVIGASMSYGYGARPGLQFSHVLAKTLRSEIEIAASATPLFFASPIETGSEQSDFAIDEEATLIVALDYLFWFGYGMQNADGLTLVSEAERLELLEVGLDNLDQLEGTIVVGDFPDMSAAVGGMLYENQMPELETLGKLNSRVHAWAKERKNTLVIPLAKFVHSLNSNEAFEAGRFSVAAGSRKRLIQSDQLHPTLAGLCLLAHVVSSELAKAGLAKEVDLELDLLALLAFFDLDAQGIQPIQGPATKEVAGERVGAGK